MSAPTTVTVKLLSGGMAGLMKEFSAAPEILIGRDAQADVRLHPTEDNMVGRRHARLFWQDTQWRIESTHEHGVFLRGQRLTEPTTVRDGDVYQLGAGGPEFRVALLEEEVQATFKVKLNDPTTATLDAGAPTPRPLRRVEYDPNEVQANLKQESRRTLRIVLPAVLVLVGCGGLGVWWFMPREDPLIMTASQVQTSYSPSVFRAAATVRMRCKHPDAGENDFGRYWTDHGSSFAVGEKDGWIYALTNYHVFGEPAKPEISTPAARGRLQKGVLERWPRDWPKFAAKLAEFEDRRAKAAGEDPDRRAKIDIEFFEYIAEVAKECEIDVADAQWRQVIVDGQFTPVEVVESSEQGDVVLFRFKAPTRKVAPLPLRILKPTDHLLMSGRQVHILGFPGVGDLPLKKSSDAVLGQPDVASGVLSNIKPDDLHGGFSIQVTAPINRGNSGGPLFDYWGNVIGLNTWGPSKAEAEGVSYSIGVSRAIDMMQKQGLAPVPPRMP